MTKIISYGLLGTASLGLGYKNKYLLKKRLQQLTKRFKKNHPKSILTNPEKTIQ